MAKCSNNGGLKYHKCSELNWVEVYVAWGRGGGGAVGTTYHFMFGHQTCCEDVPKSLALCQDGIKTNQSQCKSLAQQGHHRLIVNSSALVGIRVYYVNIRIYDIINIHLIINYNGKEV